MDSAGVECGLKILGIGLLPGDSAAHKCAASNIPVSRTSTPLVRPTTTDCSRISLFSAMRLFLTENLNSPCHLYCVFFHSHLLETAALRVSDAVLLDSGTRGFTISREPLCPVKYVQIHCKNTLTRSLDCPRYWRWTAAHASHATNPLRWTLRLCSTANPLPTTAMLPLSKELNGPA